MNYKKLYDEIYEKPYHLNWLGKYKGYEEQVRLATSLVSGRKILDIGCGEGIITSKLNGNEVIGIDISKNAIKYAKQHFENERVKFAVASALQLPFADNSFDCVCAFEVIEHLTPEDMHKCLKEIRRVCKTEGRVIISTPNLSSIYHALFHSIRINSKEHINVMDFLHVINIISKYFTILKVYSHTETPWLRWAWLTRFVSAVEKKLFLTFPPIERLFYHQVYVVTINKVMNERGNNHE